MGLLGPHIPDRVIAARSDGRPLALIYYAHRSCCMCEMLITSGLGQGTTRVNGGCSGYHGTVRYEQQMHTSVL